MTKRMIFSVCLLAIAPAWAGSPLEFQNSLAAQARAEDPAFREFSASRGEAFFRSRQGGDWSCATCHTDSPAATGRHTVTGKSIKPLAPAANADRFSDPAHSEKWFKRNCNDVLKRACTAREKGDLLAWLRTVKP